VAGFIFVMVNCMADLCQVFCEPAHGVELAGVLNQRRRGMDRVLLHFLAADAEPEATLRIWQIYYPKTCWLFQAPRPNAGVSLCRSCRRAWPHAPQFAIPLTATRFMKSKRPSLFVTAMICAQFGPCAWPVALSWGAEAMMNPATSIPEIAVVKDRCLGEVFLRFSPSGRELACIPQFGPVHLSDTVSYKKVRSFKVGMRMVAYSPDGTKMATAEGTDGARVWDTTLQGRRLPEAKSTEVYMLETPLQVLEAPSPDRTKRVFWAEFSPDGRHLLTTQADGHVKVWDTSSWKVEDDLTLTQSEVRVAAFSPDSKTLAIGDVKGEVYLWNLEAKALVKSALTGREQFGPVLGLAFSPDGRTLVTSHSSKVMIWNTGTWIAQVENGFSCAAISKDGKILALGGRSIKLLNLASGKPIRTIELPEMALHDFGPGFEKRPNSDKKIPVQISALAFSPDGGTLAVGSKGPLRLVKMNPP
jgi:WD40 repeat protein